MGTIGGLAAAEGRAGARGARYHGAMADAGSTGSRKTLGVVGGLGPESTVDYYRSLLAAYRQRAPGRGAPPIVIDSIDVARVLDAVGVGDLAGLTRYLSASLDRLARAGADLAILAANTPHVVFDALRTRAALPLVSIVEAACDAAVARGLRRLGLLGTRATMEGTFYSAVFSRAGLALVAPAAADRALVHARYVDELLRGVFLPETRVALLAVVERLVARDGVDGVLLAGTELPLILRQAEHAGVPLLDTTKIHAERAIEELARLEEDS